MNPQLVEKKRFCQTLIAYKKKCGSQIFKKFELQIHFNYNTSCIIFQSKSIFNASSQTFLIDFQKIYKFEKLLFFARKTSKRLRNLFEDTRYPFQPPMKISNFYFTHEIFYSQAKFLDFAKTGNLSFFHVLQVFLARKLFPIFLSKSSSYKVPPG